MKTKPLTTLLAAPLSFALFAGQADAAAVFTEIASDPFYNSGWENGSSQPDNFGWFTSTTTTGTGFAGRFIGDSTIVSGGSGGNINTAGESWGMFAGNGASGYGQSDAYGFLKDGSGNDAALSAGQMLSLDLAVNFRNGQKGVAMRDALGTELFTFEVSNDDYVVMNATTGNGSIGDDYSSDTVFNVSVTQTSLAGGTWSITRSGEFSDFDSGTYTGLVSNFRLYVSATDGGDPNNLMANNVSVIPEPGTALLTAGGLMLLLVRRRPGRAG